MTKTFLAEGSDFVIRPANLPQKVHSAVLIDQDGRANIYINPNAEEIVTHIEHELDHVWNDDHYKTDIRQIETPHGKRIKIESYEDWVYGRAV